MGGNEAPTHLRPLLIEFFCIKSKARVAKVWICVSRGRRGRDDDGCEYNEDTVEINSRYQREDEPEPVMFIPNGLMKVKATLAFNIKYKDYVYGRCYHKST